MDAKKILRKLNYIPRWLWYVAALFIGNLPGVFVAWLGFHILGKKAEEQEEEEAAARAAFRETWQDSPEGAARGDGYRARNAEARGGASSRGSSPGAASSDPIDPDAEVADVLRQGRRAMRRIREANDAIPDPLLSAKIDSIEKSCRAILDTLEQRPELLPQLRTFLRYYLPTTLKLLDARARLDTAATPRGRQVRRRIGEAMDQVDRAFQRQLDALEEYRFVDLESEMDVLTDMLRSDGLLDEEEKTPGSAGGR